LRKRRPNNQSRREKIRAVKKGGREGTASMPEKESPASSREEKGWQEKKGLRKRRAAIQKASFWERDARFTAKPTSKREKGKAGARRRQRGRRSTLLVEKRGAGESMAVGQGRGRENPFLIRRRNI